MGCKSLACELQIARKISSSIDLQWEGRSCLMFDILNLALESIKCGCKVISILNIVADTFNFLLPVIITT